MICKLLFVFRIVIGDVIQSQNFLFWCKSIWTIKYNIDTCPGIFLFALRCMLHQVAKWIVCSIDYRLSSLVRNIQSLQLCTMYRVSFLFHLDNLNLWDASFKHSFQSGMSITRLNVNYLVFAVASQWILWSIFCTPNGFFIFWLSVGVIAEIFPRILYRSHFRNLQLFLFNKNQFSLFSLLLHLFEIVEFFELCTLNWNFYCICTYISNFIRQNHSFGNCLILIE